MPEYLKDREHAKAILMSYNRFNINSNGIEAVKEIQNHWKFNIKEFDILLYLQESIS